MRIIVARPPNFEAIKAVFPLASRHGVIFTYGDAIYNPDNVEITSALKAHEGVHADRQLRREPSVELWWMKYLEDPAFRFAEELPAHRAEWKTFCDYARKNNWQKEPMLHAIATRLSSALYGELISYSDARRRLTA